MIKKIFMVLAVFLMVPFLVSALTIDNVNVTTGPGGKINAVFTVSNNDNVNYTGLSASVDDLTDYSLAVSPTTFDIANGTTKTLTVTGTVPITETIGVTRTTNIHVTGAATAQGTLQINVTNMVEIRNVRVESGDYDTIVTEGEDFRRLKLGEVLTISGDIYNLYTSADDIDFDSVDVDLRINNIDDGSDYTDTDSLDSINAGRNDNFEFNFDVGYRLRDGKTYDVDLTITADDMNGNLHEITMTFSLTVDRDSNELYIEKAEFQPSIVSCSRTTQFAMNVINIGSNDQDKVTYQFYSTNSLIPYNEKVMEITLDSNPSRDDNEHLEYFTVNVPDNVPAGMYTFKAVAYYKTDKKSDEKLVFLQVNECPTTTTTTTTTTQRQTTTTAFVTTTTMYIPPTQESTGNENLDNEQGQQQVTVPQFETVSSNDNITVALLVVGIIVGLALIGVLVALLMKK